MTLIMDSAADTTLHEPRFIRLPEVSRRVGLGKTKIYGLIKEGDFPPATKIGGASLWRNDAVTRWLNKKSAP